MKRLVLKFGGTSVGTIEKIKKVANIVKKDLVKAIKLLLLFQQCLEKRTS